ncbi:MAG: efflux RND transporter periplasmic adaptor subunit [Candidatus Acididesulfobacter guangdongensis]|uniref:Efflux RND transporter periplasmic adaptor subunit n=1 Tax=Acididesulfobacter guangdongensis TaxID=2597225 RepID=A0A519BFP2_ACIG2|nr:MAG: efflux RND transporter periplasmic adaptor subunit [Candidatus Acididesulfobacter guangdongensis]
MAKLNIKTYKRRFDLKFLFAFFLLLMLPVIFSGCAKKQIHINQTKHIFKVSAIKTGYKIISKYLNSPGNVYSTNSSIISAHIMGYIVYDPLHSGEFVRKGELLLKISAPAIGSKYFAAKANYLNAKTTFERMKRLYKENSISKQSFDNANMSYRIAKANLNEALSYLDYKNIYSPLTGEITQKNVSEGNLVSPGQMLLTIQNVNSIIFKTNVNVNYYRTLLKNTNVNLKINSIDKKIKGRIITVVKSANPYSHTILVRIKILNPSSENILPGMYGVAYFKIGQTKAMIVPASAIFRKLGISGVYIANKQGKVMFQPVKKGPVYNNKYIIILNGLQPGLTVITSGINKLEGGDYVLPIFQR